jgi:uncharacterized membrane protein
MPLHPSIVHFPIVLLILAGGCYVAHLFVKGHKLDLIAFFLHAGGLLGCVAAILTGDYAESNMIQTPEIHEMVELHEQLGMLSAYAFGILGVWAFLRQKSKVKPERILFVILFVGVVGMMGFSAHIGGRMVYEEGAGVLPMQPILEQQRSNNTSRSSDGDQIEGSENHQDQ